MRRVYLVFLWGWIAIGLCFGGGVIAGVCGLRINIGQSLPWTLAWCRTIDAHPIERGTLVEFLAPPPMRAILKEMVAESAFGMPWIKEVWGTEGDVLCWTPETLWINGVIARNLVLRVRYPALVHPLGCMTLTAGDVLLLGTHPQSYDGRYSGPLPRSALTRRCTQLF